MMDRADIPSFEIIAFIHMRDLHEARLSLTVAIIDIIQYISQFAKVFPQLTDIKSCLGLDVPSNKEIKSTSHGKGYCIS